MKSRNRAFRQAKRFYLIRARSGNILIKGELHYNNDLNTAHNVFKKSKTPKTIRLPVISRCSNAVSHLKINDVKKLLEKPFGEQWRELQELSFYNEFIADETIIDPNENNAQEDPEDQANCEFVEELPSVLIKFRYLDLLTCISSQ